MCPVDYDYYLNTYYGAAIGEEDFPRLAQRAWERVDSATQGLAGQAAQEDAREAVRGCVCNVAELLLNQELLEARVFSGEQSLASESVGSWLRTYRSPTLETGETDYLEQQIRKTILSRLGHLPAFSPVFRVRSYP